MRRTAIEAIRRRIRDELPDRSSWLPYLVLLVAAVYFGLFMPYRVRSDMSHILATATTMVESGFSDAYAYPEPMPSDDVRFVERDGKAFTVYPKTLELLVALPVLLSRHAPITAGLVVVGLLFVWLANGRKIVPVVLVAATLAVLSSFVLVHERLGETSDAHTSVAVFQTLAACSGITLALQLFRALGIEEKRSLALTAALLFGSFWVYYSKAYTRDVYYLVPVVAALLFLVRRRFLLAGIAIGMVTFVKYVHAILALPAVFAYLAALTRDGALKRKEALRAAAAILGLTIVFLVVAKGANVLYLGRADAIEGIFYLRHTDLWLGLKEVFEAAVGYTVSSGKGMLFYFPLSFMLVFVGYRAIPKHPESVLLAAMIVLHVGFYVAVPLVGGVWSGDSAWGPRYLLQATVPIAALIGLAVPDLSTRKVVVLTVLGALMNLPGAIFAPHAAYSLVTAQRGSHRPALFEPEHNPTIANLFLIGRWAARSKEYVPIKMPAPTFESVLRRIEEPADRATLVRAFWRDPTNGNYYVREEARTETRSQLVAALRAAGFYRYYFGADGPVGRLIHRAVGY